ncbi:MAG TPA: ATP-binding protein, partial [Lautropia sp.]|nr:ATP-binding protein [Lautropia sp.]
EYDLLVATLEREGVRLRSRRVQTAAQLAGTLTAERWDAVISDHQPKGFSSHEALDIVRAKLPHCPFIIISGPMGEDAAVVAMRRGVDDYLVKGRLARLVPSLLNAIAAADARRERAEARDSLERSESQLRELLSHLETVVDEERKQIAGEIHDDIGGALTALRLDMNWIARNGDAASAGHAAQAMQTLSRVMDASLRLQQRLRPAVLDQGLVPALRWLVEDAGRRSDTIVDFRCTGEDAAVDAATALATYRTLQESLTNIMKHAGATRVNVGLVVGPGQLSLEITDNGRGIRPADCRKPTAFGLRGMEERARSLGGWVEVSSLTQGEHAAVPTTPGVAAHAEVVVGDVAPRRGTVVFLSLPLQAGHVSASAASPAGGIAAGSAASKAAGATQVASALRASRA